MFNKKEPIRMLLKAGVLLSEVDKNQNTLLHIAAEKSLLEFFKRIANYHIIDRENQSVALSKLQNIGMFILSYIDQYFRLYVAI